MTRGTARRLVLIVWVIAPIAWLFVACAAGRPTNLIRLREGYEVLTAHCEARPPESCTPVRVTGDPRDEEAWASERDRPPARCGRNRRYFTRWATGLGAMRCARCWTPRARRAGARSTSDGSNAQARSIRLEGPA
jgi:hypothetical protein